MLIGVWKRLIFSLNLIFIFHRVLTGCNKSSLQISLRQTKAHTWKPPGTIQSLDWAFYFLDSEQHELPNNHNEFPTSSTQAFSNDWNELAKHTAGYATFQNELPTNLNLLSNDLTKFSIHRIKLVHNDYTGSPTESICAVDDSEMNEPSTPCSQLSCSMFRLSSACWCDLQLSLSVALNIADCVWLICSNQVLIVLASCVYCLSWITPETLQMLLLLCYLWGIDGFCVSVLLVHRLRASVVLCCCCDASSCLLQSPSVQHYWYI